MGLLKGFNLAGYLGMYVCVWRECDGFWAISDYVMYARCLSVLDIRRPV